jgi:hypothetical protein
MVSTFTHLNIFSSELEITCVELIEYELKNFFSAKSKSAYTYALIVAQNFKRHNKCNFEKIVLNHDELIFLIEDIVYKLNRQLNGLIVIHKEKIKYESDKKIICLKPLDNTILQNKKTSDITICCEKVIDKAILKSLNLYHSGLVTDYLLKKINFGKLMFKRNSSKNQAENNKNELHNQIEGLLINIKIDIRNLILKNVMKQIKIHLNAEMIA